MPSFHSGTRRTSAATTAVRNNPANQAPEFKEEASTFRVVAENTMALTGTDDDDAVEADNPDDNVGGPVEATDADADTPTYTLSGGGRGHVQGEGQRPDRGGCHSQPRL